MGYLIRATGSTLGCLAPLRRSIILFRLYILKAGYSASPILG